MLRTETRFVSGTYPRIVTFRRLFRRGHGPDRDYPDRAAEQVQEG